MKIALVSSTVSLLFAFLGFLSLADVSKHFQYSKVLVYIEFMIIPLVSTLSLSWLNGITSSYLSVVHRDIKTKRDVMKKLFVLRFMIEKAQRKSKEEEEQATRDLRFYGTYKKKISRGGGAVEKNKITEVKEIMREFLEEMTQKFPHNQLLKTLLIDVSLDNTNLALEVMMFSLMELAKIQGKAKLITLKLSQRLQKKVTYFFENNKHKILDLNQFLEHDNITNKMDYAIQRHIKNYIIFWSAYLKPNIQIKDFYLKSKDLEKNADYIENIWKQRVEPDRLLAGSLYQLYTMYLFLLRASPFKGQIVSKKYTQYYREKAVHHDGLMGNTEFTNEDLTDLNVFTIHASIMRESPGKILEVSANFKQTTGWNKTDAIGRNVNLLLPRWIAKSHYKFLMEHLKRLNSGGTSERMYQTIPTYFQHHDGYIIPCDIYLSLHPIVQETPVYIVFVRINTTASGEKLLISKDGNIEGFTEGIGNFLNLSHNMKTTIENVCGDASEIRDAIQRLEKNSEEEEYMIRPFTVDFVSLKVNNSARIGLPCNVSVRPYLFDGEIYYFLSVAQKISKTGEESKKVFFSQVDEEGEEVGLIVERFASELIEDDNLDELADGNGAGVRAVSLASSVPIFSYRSEKLLPGTDKEYRENTTQVDSPSKRKGEIENVYSYGDVQSGTFLNSTNRGLFDRKNNKAKEKTLLLKKKKSQIQDKLFEASSSIGSNKKQTMTKFERALVNIPKNPQLKWTYLLFLALMAVAALALVLFQQKNDSILNQVHGSEETISNTIFRLTRYTDVYAYSRIISQAVSGITAPYKFAPYGYTISTVDFSVLQLTQVLQDVRSTNAAIQDFIPKLDSSLVEEIYNDLVPVYETMPDGSIIVTRHDNLFDLSIELVAWGLRFLESGLPLDLENPYVDFLLNNTMNDPLLANEREVPLMVNNNDIQLNHLSTFLYVVIAITCVFAVCIFVFFVRIVKTFQKERNQFILVFTNIYDKHISDHLGQLENFQNILIKTKEKTYKSHTQILASLPSKRNHNNSSSSSNRPKVDTKGVNRVLYVLYVALACFLLAICSAFPILIGTFKESSKTILNKLDLMTQSNLNLYNLVYYWNTLYAYCEPGVVDWEYVKNTPLAEGVLDAYEAVLNVQDFIVNTLLNPDNGLSDNQELKNTVVGNLCELYTSSDELVAGFCPTLGSGAATKGVLGLHTYYVVGLHAVQQCYNYSSRAFADSQRCLSLTSIVDTEVIYPVLYWAYQNMDSIIKEEIGKDYTSLKTFVESIEWIFIVGYLLFGTLVGWRILKKMNDEMTDWRKMMRQLPFTVGKENKFLQVFLQNNRSNV